MKLFEILIFTILFISLLGERISKLKNSAFLKVVSFTSIGLIIIHLLVEGYRWQMVPIYFISSVYLLLNVTRIVSKKNLNIKNKNGRRIFAVTSFALYLFALIFPALLPVVDLPMPSGQYDVGTTSFRMTDYDREEVYTQDENDTRNILVTAWYPADIDENMTKINYWDKDNITGKAYSINSGMGSFWYSHLELSKTNSYLNAPLSKNEKEYPVIIYSHSFYGLNTENTMLFEKLASKGYIVFSINHSYETIVSIYPDGEVVYGDLEYFSQLYDDNYEKEEILYQEYNNTQYKYEKESIISDILIVDDQSTQTIKIRRDDIIFLMDEIEKMNQQDGMFKDKLDLDNIGAIGWSFGGAAIGEASIEDSRIKAVVNIDGWPYGELFAENDINQPYMLIQSDTDDDMESTVGDLIYSKLKNDAYRMKIKDTSHINFWDFPMLLRVYKYIGYWGSLDAEIMNDIHEAYTVSFFDKYLKHKDIDIISKNKNMFLEVEIEYK